MTDFAQTMEDWRRMCKTYSTDDDKCCAGCPLDTEFVYGCGDVVFDDSLNNYDWNQMEKVIDKWAEEHPEPVYPTWADYITVLLLEDITHHNVTEPITLGQWMGKTHIPADIAEKLGIQPKEGE